METIERLRTNSRIGEVATTGQSIGVSYKNAGIEDPYLSDLMGQLNNIEEKLSLSINRDKIVSDLEAGDDKRDNRIRGIFNLNTGYMYHPSEDVSTAASVMNKVLDKYGKGMISDSYSVQSANVESMLKDFASEEVKAAIDKLDGMSVHISNLDTEQKEFVDQFVAYKEAKAQEDNFTSASELKCEILDLINNKIVTYLNAMQQARPDMYESFAKSVAQIISDNNASVKARRKKAAEAEE